MVSQLERTYVPVAVGATAGIGTFVYMGPRTNTVERLAIAGVAWIAGGLTASYMIGAI